MKNFGVSDNLTKAFTDVVRIDETDKKYVHKIIAGPRQYQSIFYPSFSKDGKEIILTVPPNELFKRMQKIDEEIHKNEEKYRSPFAPTTTYRALILDKADSVPIVKLAEYKYSIAQHFGDLERAPYMDDTGATVQNKLQNGLKFMWWAVITKKRKDESKKESWNNVEYIVQAHPTIKKPFSGKIPIEVLSANVKMNENGLDLVTPSKTWNIPYNEIFTQLEWEAIQNCEYDIVELTAPLPDDAVMEKLHEYPINFMGISKFNGTPYYDNIELLIKNATQYGLPVNNVAGQIEAPKSNTTFIEPAKPQVQEPVKATPVVQTVDTSFPPPEAAFDDELEKALTKDDSETDNISSIVW